MKHIKNGGSWNSFGCLRYAESFSEPQSIRRRLARACARATGRRINSSKFHEFDTARAVFLNYHEEVRN